jgi:hypothetical protein
LLVLPIEQIPRSNQRSLSKQGVGESDTKVSANVEPRTSVENIREGYAKSQIPFTNEKFVNIRALST